MTLYSTYSRIVVQLLQALKYTPVYDDPYHKDSSTEPLTLDPPSSNHAKGSIILPSEGPWFQKPDQVWILEPESLNGQYVDPLGWLLEGILEAQGWGRFCLRGIVHKSRAFISTPNSQALTVE